MRNEQREMEILCNEMLTFFWPYVIENTRILMRRRILPFAFHLFRFMSLIFFSTYIQIYSPPLPFPFSLSLSVFWYNYDSYAQMLPASSVRNFRNCVVKQLTGILSSSCDESVNEISGNRRIGRSARPSPKGNVSRCDSALKTCRSSWHRESRKRDDSFMERLSVLVGS